MIQPSIRVFKDIVELSSVVAERFAALARENVDLSGRFRVGLSGGKTPTELFRKLAAEPCLTGVPWEHCEIFFVDERCVGPMHAESNFGQATRLLLDEVPVPYEKIYRMKGEEDPKKAADEYDRLLKGAFGDDGGLDLTILGIGADGHTASLFPGTTDWDAPDRLCVASFVPKLNAWRLTITPAFINRSRVVFFMVAGAEKAQAVAGVLEQWEDYPARVIAPKSGNLEWYLDASAAMMDE